MEEEIRANAWKLLGGPAKAPAASAAAPKAPAEPITHAAQPVQEPADLRDIDISAEDFDDDAD